MNNIKLNNNSIQLNHVKNEKIQIFLRILIVVLIILTLPNINTVIFTVGNSLSVSILSFMLTVVFCNIVYYVFIQKFPYLYQKERISFIAAMDVFASVFIMSFVGYLASYYTALLLWYSVGYGMRYDKVVGYVAYISVLISWMFLITTNQYWLENTNFAVGWLIAFIVIPLYYFRLVSELKRYIEELHTNVDSSNFQASHDILTQLPNRLLFNQKLDYSISAHKKFALFFIDLDKFKNINDEFGHLMGDSVLIEASKRMTSLNHFIARISGDEFVSIVEYDNMQELKEIAQKYSESINVRCKKINIELSASIGVACFPMDANNAYELKKSADEAMYYAKTNGKNRFYFYSDIKREN